MIYCFDLDGTLCVTKGNKYEESTPIKKAIDEVNKLFLEGHQIKIFTARGMTSKIDWTEFTFKQLNLWGLKFHELITNTKPSFDILIDDKAINANDWLKTINKKVGFLAGSFDIIHPGYVLMLQDAKTVCDHLIVGLQADPTIDRPQKNKPIQTIEERKLILSSIKFVDEVKIYSTEKELYDLLKNTKIDIRILGSDYKNINFNGCDLNIPTHFHERNHDWSATKLKKQIIEMGIK